MKIYTLFSIIKKWWYTSREDLDFKYIYLYKGKIHRDDAPAVIWNSGRVEFYSNGKRHRIDGPAVIDEFYLNRQNSIYEYWYEGKKIECKNTEEFKRKIKLLSFI